MLRPTVVLFALTGAVAAQPTSLRPLRFALEQRTTFDVTTATTLDLGLAGASTELTLRASVEAVGVAGEHTRLRVTWDEVYGEIAIRLMTVRFDSRKEVKSDYRVGNRVADRLGKSIVDDIRAPHLALKGFSYDVIVDKRGAIVELPGLGEKLDALRKKIEKGPNPKMVRTFYSEDGLRWQVRMLVPAQPADGARVGDRWKRSAVHGLGNSAMGRAETTIACDLAKIEDGEATIRWSGEPKIGNPKVHVRDSSLDGEQVVSLDDGMPLRVDVEVELDVELRGKLVVAQKLACEYEVIRLPSRPEDDPKPERR